MQFNLPYEDTVMLWNDVVEMAHDLEDASILPWLERVAPVSLQDGTMTVSTRQNWTARKLAGEYRPVIEGLLRDITLEPITLDVVVASAATTSGAAGETVGVGATGKALGSGAAESAASGNNAINGQTGATNADAPMFHVKHSETPPAASVAPASESAAVNEPTATRLSPAALAGAAVAASRSGRFAQTGERRESVVPAPTEQSSPITGAPSSAEQPQTPAHDTPTTAAVPTNPANMLDSVPPILTEDGLSRASVASGFSDFSFDTYIVGESNKLAFGMARTVAEQPGGVATINPLFIWGPSGYGKTHLLLSISNYLHEHQPSMSVQYVPANTFVDQYIDDIRNRGLKGKKVLEIYRTVDVLLVDDVQFFQDKQESVGMFFDIFNQLVIDGKQIVLAADMPPDYLRLDDRIRTRFGGGAVVDITAPTYEMKCSILHSFYNRCRERMEWCDVEISDDLFGIIAKDAPNNPRNMQGLMTSLLIKANSDPSILSQSGIRGAIRELFKENEAVTMAAIIRRVCEEYGVSADDVKGPRRTKDISMARKVTMWLARELTDETYVNIGAELGGRDHSTVYYGIRDIESRASEDKAFLYHLNNLKKEIVE